MLWKFLATIGGNSFNRLIQEHFYYFLRNLIRKKDEIQLPSEDNYKDFISVKYSIQKDILDIWENALKNSDDSEVESLDETERGEGGYGHTGVK